MIPPAFIDSLIAKTDIADLAAAFTELVERGHNLVGACPIHGGTGTTFTVSPDKML